MQKPKIRVFRVELGICLLAPPIVLFCIAVFGYGYVASAKQGVMRHVNELQDIPLIEARLGAANKTLSVFRQSSGGKENGEWAHRISQTATAKGVTLKSVNTEKVMPERIISCHDYRIQVSGEGSMSALVGWLDELDQPTRCFKVSSFKMRPVKLNPFPVYEFESVFQVRTLALRSEPGPVLPGSIDVALERMSALRASVNSLAKIIPQELDTRDLALRENASKSEPIKVAASVAMTLKLTGIVNDERNPLALTDRGVFGVGDVIDGYKVVRVGVDQLMLENAEGQQKCVQLYRAEENQ